MKLNNIVLILFFMVLANAKIIMIIRHGEKINDDYTDLSPQGKARAFCLINVFGSNGTYPSPQKIYAQSPSEKKQSTRPRDTVVPLANELGLQVDLSYESGKIKKLTENVIISSEEVILFLGLMIKFQKLLKSLELWIPQNGIKMFLMKFGYSLTTPVLPNILLLIILMMLLQVPKDIL